MRMSSEAAAAWTTAGIAAVVALAAFGRWIYGKWRARQRSRIAFVRAYIEAEGRRPVLVLQNAGEAGAEALSVVVDEVALAQHPVFGYRVGKDSLRALDAGERRSFRGLEYDAGRLTFDVRIRWTSTRGKAGESGSTLNWP